jgi:murein DD-endopeptidase MepM/ murein hydrolase activator NlpD
MLHQLIKQNNINFSDVIAFKNKSLFQFDFSNTNPEIIPEVIKDTESLDEYIKETLKKHNADIGFGGYLENRVIYKKSDHFGGNDENARTIHLGTDIWCKAQEPIFAPYNALIHSFKNNDNFGDYGGTIILEHKIENTVFYTLYGHLSKKSLKGKKVGQKIKKGKLFAELGNDISDCIGDFPGVCSLKDKDKFTKLCPNPNLILTTK